MTISAKFEGVCSTCGGRIREGESINWTKGVKTVSHAVCPAQPEAAPVRFSWSKSPIDDSWNVRVQDPTDAQEYEGEEVTVTARSGRSKTVTLGKLVQANSSVDCVYTVGAPAKPAENLPPVPNGYYVVTVGDVLYIVKVVEFRNGTVHVFDADEWGNEYDAKTLLEAIAAAGPGACAQMYGKLRSRCARCNSPLENRLSVELAIGPVCGKHYWSSETWTQKKAEARAKIRAEGHDPSETVRTGEVVSN